MVVASYDLAALDSKALAGQVVAQVDENEPWQVGDIGGFFHETQPTDGREHLRVLAFDCRGCAMGLATLSIGTPVSCEVSIRDILRFVVSIPGAVAFAVTHNHPSGQCEPSGPDREVTISLRRAAEHCGLVLICHVITGRRDWALADPEEDANPDQGFDDFMKAVQKALGGSRTAPTGGPGDPEARKVPGRGFGTTTPNPELGKRFGLKERG